MAGPGLVSRHPATAPAAVLSSSSLQDLAIVNPFHHPDLSEVDILIFVVFQPSAYSTYFMSATHCADSLEFKIFIYLSFITQSNMT